MTSQLFFHVLIVVGLLFSPSTNQSKQTTSTYDEVLAGMRTFKNAAGDLEADFHAGQYLRNGKIYRTIRELRKTK
ncbi:MAG TPA: hypothetical protein VGB89_12050 [Bacteroidota bacterium]